MAVLGHLNSFIPEKLTLWLALFSFDYENITPYLNFVRGIFKISKNFLTKYYFQKLKSAKSNFLWLWLQNSWQQIQTIRIYNLEVKFSPTGKNFEPGGHFMVKICRNLLILVTSGDLGWTLIPIVTILKIISDFLGLFRAQNHDSSLKFTKKIISLRFSENRSIKFSTSDLDFYLKNMKFWKSR